MDEPNNPGRRSAVLAHMPRSAHYPMAESWWSWAGSNRRPCHCERHALPTELQPHSTLTTRMLGSGYSSRKSFYRTFTPMAETEFPSSRILVFAKAPVAGQCKTRLGRSLGMTRSANIHRQLVAHTLQTVTASQLAPAELYCAPAQAHPYFQHLARRFNLPLKTQSQGDLGQRMHRALKSNLQQSEAAIVIGTDCPELNSEHLRRSLVELHSGQDAVFIPTLDGGYALVGLSSSVPLIFQQVQWGSAIVMQQTRRRLHRAGLKWTELAPLNDVDERADYHRARRLGQLQA